MAKHYFDNEDEGFCYGISYFKELMKEEDISEMELYEGVREIGQDHFFCNHFQEVGIKDEGQCGRICEGYSPRNGKNGRCKHSKNTYFPGQKYRLLKTGNQFKLEKSIESQHSIKP